MNEQKLKTAVITYIETGAEELLIESFAELEIVIPPSKVVAFLSAFCKISDELCAYIEGIQHE